MRRFNKTLVASAIACITLQAQAAVYEIEEIKTPENFKHAFGQDMNESGTVISSVEGIDFNALISSTSVPSSVTYNHPIDLSKLDFEDEDLLDILINDADEFGEDFDYVNEVKSGSISSDAYFLIMLYLHSNYSTPENTTQTRTLDGRYHPLAEFWMTQSNGEQLEYFTANDTRLDNNEYSLQLQETGYGINDNGWIVGITGAPYVDEAFTNTDGEAFTFYTQEFSERAFVKINDNTVLLPPPYIDEIGGRSTAYGLNNDGFVVGMASIGFLATDTELENLVQSCEDEQENFPLNVCLSQIMKRDRVITYRIESSTSNENLYWIQHAMRWKLDTQGNVIEATSLGGAFDKDQLENVTASSWGVAINDDNIAVGSSAEFFDGNGNNPRIRATIYQDGQDPITIIDQDEDRASYAIDINNNGYVIGHTQRVFPFGTRYKGFVHKLGEGDNDAKLLPDAFEGANTRVNDINNNNVIVGNSEFNSLVGSSRDSHGFVYDLDNDSFLNLNDLVRCDSNYTITDGIKINDDGTILAIATTNQPARDLVGNTSTNDDEDIIESVVKTIKLKPIGGEADNCQQQENKVERQGGSFGHFGWLSVIIIGLGLRKFSKKVSI